MYVCMYVHIRCSRRAGNRIWNRGSKLIGCEVQATLSRPRVQEPNKAEDAVTFDQLFLPQRPPS